MEKKQDLALSQIGIGRDTDLKKQLENMNAYQKKNRQA